MNPDHLNKHTRAVFDLLVDAKELNSLCLIGGTGLTLHLNHRNSLDLDFTLFEEDAKLPVYNIDQLVRRLRDNGNQVDLITDHSTLQQFSINTGKKLHDYARDYVVNGVKVTFFSGMKNKPSSLYDLMRKCSIQHENIGFSILSIDGLKISKSLILDDRVKSRDLYDLMWMMKNNHLKLHTFFTAIGNYANNNDPEYYKAALKGDIPLDSDDEGLEPVDLRIEITDIYKYFTSAIDCYEQQLAKDFYDGISKDLN